MKIIFAVSACIVLLFACNKNAGKDNNAVSNPGLQEMAIDKLYDTPDTTTAPFRDDQNETGDRKKEPIKNFTPEFVVVEVVQIAGRCYCM